MAGSTNNRVSGLAASPGRRGAGRRGMTSLPVALAVNRARGSAHKPRGQEQHQSRVKECLSATRGRRRWSETARRTAGQTRGHAGLTTGSRATRTRELRAVQLLRDPMSGPKVLSRQCAHNCSRL